MNVSKIPKLAIILANDRPDSAIYIERKQSVLRDIGFHCDIHRPNTVAELLTMTAELNDDFNVHGILVQHPVKLDKEINQSILSTLVNPLKDVDGLHPLNVGLLATRGSNPYHVPCTAGAVVHLLDHYGIEMKGKQACVLGRSAIVGLPVFHMLNKRDATVTLCHSLTPNLDEILNRSDLVIAAIGKANFIKGRQLKSDVVVVDVGINENPAGIFAESGRKLCGDVEFASTREHVRAITPVPGGIGPLTVAMLARNLLRAFQLILVNSQNQ